MHLHSHMKSYTLKETIQVLQKRKSPSLDLNMTNKSTHTHTHTHTLTNHLTYTGQVITTHPHIRSLQRLGAIKNKNRIEKRRKKEETNKTERHVYKHFIG